MPYHHHSAISVCLFSERSYNGHVTAFGCALRSRVNSVFCTQQALNRCWLLHLSDFVPFCPILKWVPSPLINGYLPSLNTVQMFTSVRMSPSVLAAQGGGKPLPLQDTGYMYLGHSCPNGNHRWPCLGGLYSTFQAPDYERWCLIRHKRSVGSRDKIPTWDPGTSSLQPEGLRRTLLWCLSERTMFLKC